ILPGSTNTNTVIARGGLRVDSTFGFPLRDTTFIPERIGETTVRPQDSVLYIYADHWYPIYRNSPNFAIADLIATGNRSHNFRGFSLKFDSVKNMSIGYDLHNNGFNGTLLGGRG